MQRLPRKRTLPATRWRVVVFRLLSLLLLLPSAIAACDDPLPPGPMGGLVLVIRTFPGDDKGIAVIDSITITTSRVEVKHDPTGTVTVDTAPRTIQLRNTGEDVLVAQYQVPVGTVTQIRIFASNVTVRLKDGTTEDLPLEGSNLPSWRQTGWKIRPIDGSVGFPIVENELTGVRALLEFDDRLLHNKAHGYKVKPTLPAELFEVNPGPLEPGVFMDQLTVVFKRGTPRPIIDGVNAFIGADILVEPRLTTAYRVKLPPSIDLQNAFRYYRSQSAVAGVLPAIDYPIEALEDCFAQPPPPEEVLPPQLDMDLPDAWAAAQARTGGTGTAGVGSHRIRVGVIDTGVHHSHPDLARNIWINEGEVPASLGKTPAEMDVDGDADGVVCFADLAEPLNDAVRPADANDNGIVDGEDLLADPRWADGNDDDSNGIRDDLVGANHYDGTNLVATDTTNHGTRVASVVGADGTNGIFFKGGAWEVSIMPLRGGAGTTEDLASIQDVALYDSIFYAEQNGAQIVNISQGFFFASDQAGLGKQQTQRILTGIPQADFDDSLESARDAFRELLRRLDGTPNRALYTVSAGDDPLDIGDENVVKFPAEPMKDVLGESVLIVGAASSGGLGKLEDHTWGSPVVDMYAPGEGWLAATVDAELVGCNQFGSASAAAPAVAGVAALIMSTTDAFDGAAGELAHFLRECASPQVIVIEDGELVETQPQPFLNAATCLDALP